MSRSRTKKIFVEYNDYHDRAFGLKWGTAFAIAELTQVISKNKHAALKSIKPLTVMTRDDIDNVLQHAFLKSKTISIQLHTLDENGSLLDSIIGKFEGLADEEHLYIHDSGIPWENIRNIKIID